MPETVDSIVAEIPALRRYAIRLVRNSTAADDLVQDALQRAIEKFHLYEPDTRLLFWLFTIMRNIFVDQYRKGKKMDLATDELAGALVRHAHPAQIDHLIQKDILRELAALKPAYRDLLLLVGAEGVSYEDAATLMGIRLGTVRSRLFRARNLLLNKVDGETASHIGNHAATRRRSREAMNRLSEVACS